MCVVSLCFLTTCKKVRWVWQHACHCRVGSSWVSMGIVMGQRVWRLQPAPIPTATPTPDPQRVTKPLSITIHRCLVSRTAVSGDLWQWGPQGHCHNFCNSGNIFHGFYWHDMLTKINVSSWRSPSTKWHLWRAKWALESVPTLQFTWQFSV